MARGSNHMSKLITSMGEILIDFLPIEDAGHTVGFKMHPGGSPFNVALGLARLDAPAAFAGKLSTDLFGRFLRKHVEAEGIDTRFALSSNAPSTLAFVSMESGEPDYAFYGEGAADALLEPDEVPPVLFDETGILHFGSISLLRGSTPAAVLSTAERLKGSALLSFDPNIRPGLIRDKDAYLALLEQLFALADIVKISAADLNWLLPGLSPADAAQDLQARGPTMVVVTRGGQGVLASRDSHRWEVPAFSLKVVDTVGAGDAFTAGMLAGLAARAVTSRSALEDLAAQEIEDLLRFASAVSGITCTRPGADPPRVSEVVALLGS